LKSVHESTVEAQNHPDRWSKNLVGTEAIPTTKGFNLGVAEYHATDGEIKLDDEILPLKPGTGVYVAPGVSHSTRRTGEAAVKVVYTHGAV